MKIGILALQGDFAKHAEMVSSLGVEVSEVRKAEDLNPCDGLIIPGGESTVMVRQIDFIHLREPLLAFAKQKPIFGTCAGLILMSKKIQTSPFKPLELIDVEIERNAFGRQIESFQGTAELTLTQRKKNFPAFFIRAPRIRICGPNVEVLGTLGGEPVLIRQGNHLGATFHPELSKDPAVHKYFLELVNSNHS